MNKSKATKNARYKEHELLRTSKLIPIELLK